MRIDGVPFGTTDWATVPQTVRPGQTGHVTSRALEVGNLRVRMVEYPCLSPPKSAARRALTAHLFPRGHPVLATALRGAATRG